MSPARRHSLGQLIRAQRQARGLSQRALAKAVGLQNSRLARLENDEVERVDPPLLEHIARILDASLEDYYLLAGYPLPQRLPELRIYMRTKYGLNDEEVAEVNKIVEQHLAKEQGGTANEGSNNTTT